MTTAMRYTLAATLLVLALGCLFLPKNEKEVALQTRNAVSSVPDKTRLAGESTTPPSAPPHTTTPRASRNRVVSHAPAPRARSGPRPAPSYQGDWAALVSSLPWDAGTAFRIVKCESGGNPNARNPRSSATGLFQILRGPIDALENVRLAFRMWQSRGWQPWNASRSCWA